MFHRQSVTSYRLTSDKNVIELQPFVEKSVPPMFLKCWLYKDGWMHLFVKIAFDDSDICHRASCRRLHQVSLLLKSLRAQLSLPPTTANITFVYSFCVCAETGLIYCMLKYIHGAFLCWIPSKFL